MHREVTHYALANLPWDVSNLLPDILFPFTDSPGFVRVHSVLQIALLETNNAPPKVLFEPISRQMGDVGAYTVLLEPMIPFSKRAAQTVHLAECSGFWATSSDF